MREGFEALAAKSATGARAEQVADGFIAIAVAKMAEAIKKISVARGYDVTRYALNCFGGAGGQHACDVADSLAIKTVLIHPLSSLLSAYGMGLADIGAHRGQGVEGALERGDAARLGRPGREARRRGRRRRSPRRASRARTIRHAPRAQLRYAGSDTALEVDFTDAPKMRRAFESAHKARFGFIDRAKAIVVEAVNVEATGGAARFVERARKAPRRAARRRRASATRFFSNGAWREARVYLRENLALGARVDGPALIIEPHQTIVVEDGWRAEITREEPCRAAAREGAAAPRGDRRQGRSGDAGDLQQSLHVDRRADGRDAAEHRLFRQHQGAARFLLRGVRRRRAPRRQRAAHAGASGLDGPLGRDDHPPQRRPHPAGDVFALNAPYNGGTHLPDITVCTPVFDDKGKAILFWIASRGHHADVGGVSPGSMSPRATNILEEGVYIDNFLLVDARPVPREGALRTARLAAPYPARNPLQNVNDLKAQIAANEKGVAGTAAHGRARSRWRPCRPIWATSRTTPPRACAA